MSLTDYHKYWETPCWCEENYLGSKVFELYKIKKEMRIIIAAGLCLFDEVDSLLKNMETLENAKIDLINESRKRINSYKEIIKFYEDQPK